EEAAAGGRRGAAVVEVDGDSAAARGGRVGEQSREATGRGVVASLDLEALDERALRNVDAGLEVRAGRQITVGRGIHWRPGIRLVEGRELESRHDCRAGAVQPVERRLAEDRVRGRSLAGRYRALREERGCEREAGHTEYDAPGKSHIVPSFRWAHYAPAEGVFL